MKIRSRNFMKTVLAALALFSAGWAWAQNAIQSFDVTQQGGQIVVRVGMKEPLSGPPASFTVATPARIAFDFANTVNGLGRSAQDITEGDLRSMNLVQVPGRTRLVLNLRNMAQYESRVDGRTLLILLTPTPQTAQASSAAAPFAE